MTSGGTGGDSGKYTFSDEELGEYDGDMYHLVVAVVPDPNNTVDYHPDDDADGLAIMVVQMGGYGESNTNIVRIDNDHKGQHGGRVHMDRLWLYPAERKRYLDERAGVSPSWGYEGARDHLKAHWAEYAYRYAMYRDGPYDARAADCPRTLAGDPL